MNEINRIIFIGNYAKNTLHQVYDTGLLHASSLISKEVVCYKDKSTFDFIKETETRYNYGNNIKLKEISIGESSNTLQKMLLFFWVGVKCLFWYCKANKNDIVIFAYNNFFALHALDFFNRFFKKRVIISCHGEMELLFNNVQGIVANLNRAILKDYFQKRKANNNFRFIILGESLKNNVKPLISDYNYKLFYSIEHPYYMNNSVMKKKYNSIHLKIGVLGTLSIIKGLDSMILFVEKLKGKGILFDFTVIGGVSSDNQNQFSDRFQGLPITVLGGSLPRKQFEEEILKLDYITFFFPHDSYKLIASGTLLDAISLKKPVIAIRNDYFDSIISRINYPALLCDNVDEMVDAFVSGKANELYQMSFENYKNIFNPVSVSKQLSGIIESFAD